MSSISVINMANVKVKPVPWAICIAVGRQADSFIESATILQGILVALVSANIVINMQNDARHEALLNKIATLDERNASTERELKVLQQKMGGLEDALRNEVLPQIERQQPNG